MCTEADDTSLVQSLVRRVLPLMSDEAEMGRQSFPLDAAQRDSARKEAHKQVFRLCSVCIATKTNLSHNE